MVPFWIHSQKPISDTFAKWWCRSYLNNITHVRSCYTMTLEPLCWSTALGLRPRACNCSTSVPNSHSIAPTPSHVLLAEYYIGCITIVCKCVRNRLFGLFITNGTIQVASRELVADCWLIVKKRKFPTFCFLLDFLLVKIFSTSFFKGSWRS